MLFANCLMLSPLQIPGKLLSGIAADKRCGHDHDRSDFYTSVCIEGEVKENA
jgi:hypothetical protein